MKNTYFATDMLQKVTILSIDFGIICTTYLITPHNSKLSFFYCSGSGKWEREEFLVFIHVNVGKPSSCDLH